MTSTARYLVRLTDGFMVETRQRTVSTYPTLARARSRARREAERGGWHPEIVLDVDGYPVVETVHPIVDAPMTDAERTAILASLGISA